jgi:8-oxo-dGTP pyrophosphatase MutT (NUDIX family)
VFVTHLALTPCECQTDDTTRASSRQAELSLFGSDLVLRRRAGCYKVRMRRELSAGVVLVRRMRGRWWLAATRPRGKTPGTWVLPKGLIDDGERSSDTALREAFEETGVRARLVEKLGDVRYVYTWEGERVFKVVSFYLARAARGRIGEIPPGMEVEVAEARWLPLEDAPRRLAYRGEREMASRAVEALGRDPV